MKKQLRVFAGLILPIIILFSSCDLSKDRAGVDSVSIASIEIDELYYEKVVVSSGPNFLEEAMITSDSLVFKISVLVERSTGGSFRAYIDRRDKARQIKEGMTLVVTKGKYPVVTNLGIDMTQPIEVEILAILDEDRSSMMYHLGMGITPFDCIVSFGPLQESFQRTLWVSDDLDIGELKAGMKVLTDSDMSKVQGLSDKDVASPRLTSYNKGEVSYIHTDSRIAIVNGSNRYTALFKSDHGQKKYEMIFQEDHDHSCAFLKVGQPLMAIIVTDKYGHEKAFIPKNQIPPSIDRVTVVSNISGSKVSVRKYDGSVVDIAYDKIQDNINKDLVTAGDKVILESTPLTDRIMDHIPQGL